MHPSISIRFLDDFEDFLYTYLNERAPQVPTEAKNTIVKYLPFAVIVMIIAQISAMLSFFHVNTLLDGLGYLYSSNEGIIGIIGLVLLGGAVVFEGIAVPLLFRNKLYGWKLMFYALIFTQINEIINLNIINILFSGLILIFLLFQIKDHYV